MASLAGAFPMDSHFVFKDAQVIFNSRQIHITEVSELLPADSGGSSHNANHLCTQLRSLFLAVFGVSFGVSFITNLTRLPVSLDRLTNICY